jgi:glucose-6-phosphate dehydrogenase assembly protein OpcA
VSEATWSERDTTPDHVEAALRSLLHERHVADAALVPARVLNLVVIVDRDWKGEVANRLERVGRYHASRTILCAVDERRTTIDARVVLSNDETSEGGVAVARERVELDLGPVHLPRLDTIVDPVTINELPTMVWSPHGHDEAVSPMLWMTDVVLLDSDDLGFSDGLSEGTLPATELSRHAYVVDLAWLRTTPWRERLAGSFDAPVRRAALGTLERITVRHHTTSEVSALLIAGWFASRLGWEPAPLAQDADGRLHGAAARNGVSWMPGGPASVEIALEPVDQGVPGIAGVTVSGPNGFALSLDRGPGGLWARVEDGDAPPREWRVLGASRGEGGILGEGVRQALLRDPTYGPALEAARRFCSE